MSDHDPVAPSDPDQEGEALDDELLPEEFPDRPVASLSYGVTEAEQARGESLGNKLSREEPDIGSPSHRRKQRDAAADDDSLDLLTDLDEDGSDSTDTLVASRAEADRDDLRTGEGTQHSAEEEAMHVVREVPGGADRRSVRQDDR